MIYAQELGLKINFMEPLLSLLSEIDSILLVSTLLILISDVPFRDKGDYYTVYRVGRFRWLSAKILVMLYFIVLFIIAVLMASMLFSLPAIELDLSYSDFVQLPKIHGVTISRILPVGDKVLANYSLGEAVLYAGGIFFLWGTILGLIILNSNLKYSRFYGVILAALTLPLGRLASQNPSGFHGLFYYMDITKVDKALLPVTISVMIVIIFILTILALTQVGRHSMHEKE